MSTATAPLTEPGTVEFRLHALATIRLIGATPGDVAVVRRQLGPLEGPPAGEPDLVIRFVDRLHRDTKLRLLGDGEAGYTDDAFLILRGKHKSSMRVQIPFDQIGDQCEIVCEHGVNAVPLLISILNLTLLAKGILPLHGTAFRQGQDGILTTGWSKGGKTETLLGFMANGAEYIGDEWIYLSPDNRIAYGIPEPIRVWDWHLDELPVFRARISRGKRVRLRVLRTIASGLDCLARVGIARSGAARLSNLVKKQLYVHLPPQATFGIEKCPLVGTWNRILLVGSHESDAISIRPVDTDQIAKRMLFSLQEERQLFLSYYWMFRFAFPERSNRLIETAADRESELIANIFQNAEGLEVLHPYPVSIPRLYEAIKRAL